MVQFPAGTRHFFLQSTQTSSVALTASYSVDIKGPFPRGIVMCVRNWLLIYKSAKVILNVHSHTSTPHYALWHSVYLNTHTTTYTNISSVWRGGRAEEKIMNKEKTKGEEEKKKRKKKKWRCGGGGGSSSSSSSNWIVVVVVVVEAEVVVASNFSVSLWRSQCGEPVNLHTLKCKKY